MKKFDVIIIGAGPAGYAAAMRAVDFKKKVALIEKDKLGGAGIHNGALWSKTLWEISTTASMLRTQGSGLNVHDLDFQMDQINDEVNTALDGRVNQLKHHMDQINTALESDFFEIHPIRPPFSAVGAMLYFLAAISNPLSLINCKISPF